VNNRVSVHLNGKKVVDDTVMENYWNRDQKLRNKGVIQLQTHGGHLCFRRIYIKELDRKKTDKGQAPHGHPGSFASGVILERKIDGEFLLGDYNEDTAIPAKFSQKHGSGRCVRPVADHRRHEGGQCLA
jgi:hypothetical protein